MAWVILSAGRTMCRVIVERGDEVGCEFVRAHHLVAALLEQHDGAAQHLIVAPGDDLASLPAGCAASE